MKNPAAHQMQVHAQPSIDSSSSSSMITPSSVVAVVNDDGHKSLPLVARNQRSSSHAAASSSPFKFFNPLSSAFASVFRSLFPSSALRSLIKYPTSCQRQAAAAAAAPSNPSSIMRSNSNNSRNGGSSSRKRVTGTFFGQKKGKVSFAVQETPGSEPILVLELATSTSHLAKEMASGVVRILLECERSNNNDDNQDTTTPTKKTKKRLALWDEPVWTMYCNGHKLGYAISRDCTASDIHVLSTVQSVSVGAGVMPPAAPMLPPPNKETISSASNLNGDDYCAAAAAAADQIMYMRAKYDRVIGSRDSEAFYMINPDCAAAKFNNGGPELSIFLLRI